MNKIALFSLFFCLSFSLPIFSQKTIRCYSEEKMDQIKKMDPEYARSLEEPFVITPRNQRVMDLVTIPVHVIIVHPPGQAVGTGVNFDMDHIMSQIDVLNEDFRRTNSDAGNTPDVFPADDSMIEFCMASVDPNGDPTDGVTRYGTTLNLNSDEWAIKSATGWPRENYLNMWVGPGLGGILGWAYLPTTGSLPNATLDGVVIASGTFGGPGYGTTNNYDLGRTATHEVGHYLGLYHVWRNGGCGADDNIPDTPLQDDQNFGCPNHPSPSCGNSGDWFMNYMDYVNDDCMNSFSTNQGDHMHDILNTSRASLLDAAETYCSVDVPLVVEVVLITDVSCFGGNDGSVTVQASGGSGGDYTYSINNGPFQSSNIFTDLTAGDHTVEAQDGNGNIVEIEITINEPPVLVLNIDSQTNVSCFGDTNGTLIVSGSGGTGAYQFSLDNGPFSSNNVFTNVSGGAHVITIQDANLCETQIDAFIIEPAELITLADQVSDVSCFGGANGLVSAITVGGTPGYVYTIDGVNYQSSPIFFDLEPGDYIMTIVDANNCSDEMLFTIGEPDELALSMQETNIGCFGESTGSIIIEVTGGTSSYQYSLDDIDYQSSPAFVNLPAGPYTLYVLDANDCAAALDTVLEEPEELILDLIDQTEAGCAGQSNGTVTVSSTGGSGGNNYTLDGVMLSGDTVTFTNINAGNYTLSLVDANDCTSEMEIEIVESESIAVDTLSINNVTCFDQNDGLIIIEGTGGNGPYEYSLNGGDFSPENAFIDLGPGDYNFLVQDADGCEGTAFVQLTSPPEIESEIASITNVNCNGDEDGIIIVNVSGGTGILVCTLNNESNTNGIFENLAAGTYTIIIMDELGCTSSISAEVEEPEVVILNEVSNNGVDCFGNNTGSLIVQATGGNGGFTYELNNLTNSTGVFNNLSGGLYDITATDGNGCSQTLSLEVTEPDELEATLDYVSDVSCAGDDSGAIQVSVIGGTGTMTYTLNTESNNTGLFENLGEGNYTIEIEDENGCITEISADVASTDELAIEEDDLSPVSCFGEEDGFIQLIVSGGNGNFEFTLDNETNNSGLFENLGSGFFTVTVTDGSDCTGTYEFEITEPDVVESSVEEQSDITCFGETNGSVQISAIGGSGSYTYDNGSETNTDGSFNDLASGDYEVIVTDENGCSTIQNITIIEPAELEINIDETQNAGCGGNTSGSFTVSGNGGTGALSYTANGETNSTGIFENLDVGSYPVIVTDENGCENNTQVEIEESEGVDLAVIDVNMNNCFGNSEGSIQTEAEGGSGTFEYTLGNETNNTGFFDNLPAGDYEVEVVDANGCSNTVLQSIEEPEELQSEIEDLQNIDCFGNNNGTVQFISNGGTGTIQYTLNGTTNETGLFENLAADNYDLVTTDANGCTTSINITIDQPEALDAAVTENIPVDCFGNNTGFVQLNASGGTGTYEYTLDGQTNSSGDFLSLFAGDYQVLITDENGCEFTSSVTVSQPDEISSEIIDIQNIDCGGTGTGSVQIQATGGNGGILYTLNNQTNGTGFFDDLPTGNYEIEISDQSGCSSTQPFEITEGANLNVAIEETAEINCFGDDTGSIQVSADGGSGNYTFDLDGQMNTSGTFENLSGGLYIITVIDDLGCESQMQYEVNQPDEMNVNPEEIVQPDCFGNATGALQFAGQGGTGTYQYTLNGSTNNTGEFNDLIADNYLIIVTDGNGCTTSSTIELEEPEMVVIDHQTEPLSCYGAEDGTVTIQGAGGTGIFFYTLGNDSNTIGTFANLPGGVYPIIVTDANGCTSTDQVTVSQPDAIEPEIIELESIGCGGVLFGSVEVNASGGTGGLLYTLGSETNSSGSFGNLLEGDYTMNIVDQNGCSTSIDFSIDQTADLEAEIISNQAVSCFGSQDGTIELGVMSGSGTYTYILGTESNSTGIFTNLPAGNYTAEIDGNGCETSISFSIGEPEELIAEAFEISPLTCFEGNDAVIQIEAFGGSGPFDFTLGNETNNFGGFENLAAGTYLATITDQNGCSINLDITIIEPDAIQPEIVDQVEPSCNGDADGVLIVEGTGGSAPYEYTIGATTNSTGVFENLEAGSYEVLILDDNGCSNTTSLTLTQPDYLISGVLNINPVSCYGGSDATIFIGADGGTPGYQFELDGVSNGGGVFFNLPAGEHIVNVTDANNCISQTTVIVSEPNELILEATNIQDDTGSGNGSATIVPSGGIGPFEYSLDNVNFGPLDTFYDLPIGSYTAYVRDANGCIAQVTFVIEMGTAISDPDQGISNIDIYPNPFSDQLYLNVDLLNNQDLEIRLFTIHGQELYFHQAEFGAGTTLLELDIPFNLAAGSYVISLNNKDGHLGFFKLIKQK